LIRALNRAAVLNLIGTQGPIARAEIARRLALSAPTVTEVTRDLVADGLVRVVAQAESNGGRPALLLGLVAGAANALGVKIAADHLAIVRVDLEGEILDRWDEPFDAFSPGAVPTLTERLHDAIHSTAGTRLLGIGLGVPGTVDPQGGVVHPPIFSPEGVALGRMLHEELGIPVLVDNDVNTLAVAERLYGRGRETDHFLTVTIGRGVGLGIVVGGDLYRGARGGAGEFGHVPVVEDGPLCTCGMHGCLEALVSDPALAREAIEAGIVERGLSTAEGIANLRTLADHGSRQARRIYARAGATFGRAIGGLINVLSPQLVIISGEGVRAWPHLVQAFEGALGESTFPSLRGVRIEVDPWDDAKWARGAAALVLRATFAAPLYERQIEDSVRARLPAASRPDQQQATTALAEPDA